MGNQSAIATGFARAAHPCTGDPAVPANPPPPQYRLAGILARDPASSPASSNTVHVALGAGSNVQAINRPDLPATLQVGPMIYSVESPASIEALFDEIDFQ